MTFDVLLFAAAREQAGADRIAVDVPDGATVDDVFAALIARHPTLGPVLDTCRAAVDEEFAPRSHALSAGQVVAVLPPVSGG